ncbi:hypothetical protein GCM10022408_06410 [Hymenobacter fastidiosus]|uniref:Uncharacterized protein n=1 Tax=Hymenobacter fastidiosus TaxID=486264 RepID=A0ABP7RJ68_9BACT
MRYRYFILLLLSSLPFAVQAQDVILRTDGEEFPARVLTIRPEKISFVLPANPADTLFLNTSDVFMIRYANGTKEMLHTSTYAAAAATPAPLTSEQARTQGQRDARKYFKAPGAFWGTFGATVVSLPIGGAGGIAAGAAIAATRPATSNLIVPDQALLQNPAYLSGYQRQAQRKKLGQAAAGFGAGLGASVVAVVVLIAIAFGQH